MTKPAKCEAKDELLCPVHGVPFGFTEVPQLIQDNRSRLKALVEVHVEEQTALNAYAYSIGWSAEDVARRWREDPAIETLYLSEREAYGALSAEISTQRKDAGKLAHKLTDDQFPELPKYKRKWLAEIAGHTSYLVGAPAHAQRPVFQFYQGLSDEQRVKLFEIDRCYKVAFHGFLPSDEAFATIRQRRDEYFKMPLVWASKAAAQA